MLWPFFTDTLSYDWMMRLKRRGLHEVRLMKESVEKSFEMKRVTTATRFAFQLCHIGTKSNDGKPR